MSLDWKRKRLPAAVDAAIERDLIAEHAAGYVTTAAQYAAMTPAQQNAVADAVIAELRASLIESRATVTTATPWRPWNHNTA